MNPVLECRDVTVSFPLRSGNTRVSGSLERIKAVDRVSFSLHKGETVGLVGESGCGKTTLGRALAMFQPVDSGKVFLRGEDLSLLPRNILRSRRRSFQMIFQNPFASLNPRMTVYDAIAEAISTGKTGVRQGRAAAEVAALLEQVGIDPVMMKKFPHEFSGGQRQRIAIARALAPGPELIIADEPVSSLDVSIAAQILNLFHELQERLHFSILFISHDLSVVRFISSSIMVMYCGRIVERGPSDALFSRPRHPYTRELLDAVPEIPVQFPSTPFFERIVPREPSESRLDGCGFAHRCPHAGEECARSNPELLPVASDNLHRCACFMQ